MLRIRRVEPGLLRRPRYEVELVVGARRSVRRTRTPVTEIDEQLGVGDAWALVQAADDAWERGHRRWIGLPTTDDS